MFLISGGTRIDENDSLERSENNTDLTAKKKKIKKDIYISKKSLLT